MPPPDSVGRGPPFVAAGKGPDRLLAAAYESGLLSRLLSGPTSLSLLQRDLGTVANTAAMGPTPLTDLIDGLERKGAIQRVQGEQAGRSREVAYRWTGPLPPGFVSFAPVGEPQQQVMLMPPLGPSPAEQQGSLSPAYSYPPGPAGAAAAGFYDSRGQFTGAAQAAATGYMTAPGYGGWPTMAMPYPAMQAGWGSHPGYSGHPAMFMSQQKFYATQQQQGAAQHAVSVPAASSQQVSANTASATTSFAARGPGSTASSKLLIGTASTRQQQPQRNGTASPKSGVSTQTGGTSSSKDDASEAQAMDKSEEGDGSKEGGEESEDGPVACAFFLKTGTCAYGDRCKFEHPLDKMPLVRFNVFGLPMRPDEPDCAFYMKNLRCGFGTSCKFNHPEPPYMPWMAAPAPGVPAAAVQPPPVTAMQTTGGVPYWTWAPQMVPASYGTMPSPNSLALSQPSLSLPGTTTQAAMPSAAATAADRAAAIAALRKQLPVPVALPMPRRSTTQSQVMGDAEPSAGDSMADDGPAPMSDMLQSTADSVRRNGGSASPSSNSVDSSSMSDVRMAQGGSVAGATSRPSNGGSTGGSSSRRSRGAHSGSYRGRRGSGKGSGAGNGESSASEATPMERGPAELSAVAVC